MGANVAHGGNASGACGRRPSGQQGLIWRREAIGASAGKTQGVSVPSNGFQCAAACNTHLGTVSQRMWVYLLVAFESFAAAFRLKTDESAACLRRFLSDQPEVSKHHTLGDGHEAIAVLTDAKDRNFGAWAVSR